MLKKHSYFLSQPRFVSISLHDFQRAAMIDETQQTAKEFYGNRIRIRVCGVCIENGQILMVRHKGVINDHELWLPPGGGVEAGENLTAALEREMREETGLEVEAGAFLLKREFIQAPLHSIELYFIVSRTGGSLKKGTDPELGAGHQLIEEVKWVSVQNREFLGDDLYLAINN